MRSIIVTAALLAFLAGCEPEHREAAADIGLGLLERESPYPAAETMDRLERAVRDRGFRVFNRLDHAAGAASVELALRPTQLLIFGNPQGGTPLMQNAQTIAIDLPLKALVYEDAEGAVKIAFNHPAFLAARHDLENAEAIVERMTALLEGLAEAATAREDESVLE